MQLLLVPPFRRSYRSMNDLRGHSSGYRATHRLSLVGSTSYVYFWSMYYTIPILLFLSLTISAQQGVACLHLETSDDPATSISYPPGTEFWLYDDTGEVVATDETLKSSIKLVGPHTLLVAPTYQKDKDSYKLSAGRISMRRPDGYWKATRDHGGYDGSDQPGVVRRELSPSQLPGEQNLLLALDNGLVFSYRDGVARAYLEGDELTIVGEYLVKLPFGTFKLSYNPRDAELWWVLDRREP